MLLQDIDEVLFRYRRFPENKDTVHLFLKTGSYKPASKETLEELLEQARAFLG